MARGKHAQDMEASSAIAAVHSAVQGLHCCAGAFISPDGQKAMVAGGITAFGSEHFGIQISATECSVPLPDLFELDLNTTCWVQASSHYGILACSPTALQDSNSI